MVRNRFPVLFQYGPFKADGDLAKIAWICVLLLVNVMSFHSFLSQVIFSKAKFLYH